MNEKQKDVLQNHRRFLTKNIIFTEDLHSRLLAQGVVPESTLKEIQACSGREAKVGKLLDVLPLRSAANYEKFCDILHLSGHAFLADFLRDEESVPESHDVKDVYKRLPSLDRNMREHEKKQLEQYLIEKIKYSIVRTEWGNAFREKEKAMDAKQKQLEQGFEFEEKTKKKNAEISALEKKYAEAKNENLELMSQIRYLKETAREMEQKFKAEFGVQMKFTMANENAITKTSEKLDKSDKIMYKIEEKLKEVLEIPARTSERDVMALVEFPYAFLLEDFDKLLQKHRLLVEIEKEYETLLEERNYILAHLGFRPHENGAPSLLTAYREFAVKTDNDLTELRRQVELHNDTIVGQKEQLDLLNKEHDGKKKMNAAGTVWQGAIMSVMRKQLQDVKHENRTKDTRIKHFESEISRLKTRLAELESELQRKRHHHHHDNKELKPIVKEPIVPTPEPMVNGQSVSNSSGIVEDDSEVSSFSKAEYNFRKKHNLLPPLGARNPMQLVDPSSVKESPRRMRPKPTGTLPRTTVDNPRMHESVEGLVTSQLKLENRVGVGITGLSKPGHNMGHGLGDLKAMHGKHGKPGQPLVKGAKVTS